MVKRAALAAEAVKEVMVSSWLPGRETYCPSTPAPEAWRIKAVGEQATVVVDVVVVDVEVSSVVVVLVTEVAVVYTVTVEVAKTVTVLVTVEVD